MRLILDLMFRYIKFTDKSHLPENMHFILTSSPLKATIFDGEFHKNPTGSIAMDDPEKNLNANQ